MPKSRIAEFYAELRSRKVIRVAIVYGIVAWVLVEIASVIFPELLLPEWSVRLVIALSMIGFPIALLLAWAVELTPDGIRRTPSAKDGSSETLATDPDEKTSGDTRPSVAVLPLLNLSGDPENEYFGDGMAEEIINLLVKLPQLKVASRTSSFSFRTKDVDIGIVADKLGVDSVVEGSVRRAGDRVRIMAQLIDAKSDSHLWSESFDREIKDVFAVQDEIARSIVDALEIKLSPAQERSIRTGAITDNMEAYDYYLRGRQYFDRGEMSFARQLFEKAIELDPGFARAWAGIADCCSWESMWMNKTPENVRLGNEASKKALELAPDLAEPHASRGFSLSLAGDYEEAEKEFQTAIELDPRLYEAYYFYGRSFFAQGKHSEAAELFSKAHEVRPEDVTAVSLRALALFALKQDDEAREAARLTMEVAERHLALNPDDARALSLGAGILAKMGNSDKALEWAERALAIDPEASSAGTTYNVACAFAQIGNTERALDVLEELASSVELYPEWLDNDPDLDCLRNEARFKTIIEKLRS